MKSIAVLGTDAPKQIKTALHSFGFDVVELKRDKRLPQQIASHADTLLFVIGNKIFTSKEYCENNADIFKHISDKGYTIIPCDREFGDKYPDDIPYNVATVGKTSFGKFDSCADEIIQELKERGYKLCNVRQGYAKCSTAVIGNNAFITADTGIAKKGVENGIDVLLIRNIPGAILLNGYNTGFIGGTCGVFDSSIYFCGNISLHPDFYNIKNFCKKHDVIVNYLSDHTLSDVGGITFLH